MRSERMTNTRCQEFYEIINDVMMVMNKVISNIFIIIIVRDKILQNPSKSLTRLDEVPPSKNRRSGWLWRIEERIRPRGWDAIGFEVRPSTSAVVSERKCFAVFVIRKHSKRNFEYCTKPDNEDDQRMRLNRRLSSNVKERETSNFYIMPGVASP